MLGFPSARLLTYPPETVVAEKLEAAVSLGRENSRMKDFFDLHWLSLHRSFEGDLLQESVRATFARRKTEIPAHTPDALTGDFANDAGKNLQWNAFRRKGGLDAPDLGEVISRLHGFLDPVLAGNAENQNWKPDTGWTQETS